MKAIKKLPKWGKILGVGVICIIAIYVMIYIFYTSYQKSLWEAQTYASYYEVRNFYLPLENELIEKLDPQEAFDRIKISASATGSLAVNADFKVSINVESSSDLEQAKRAVKLYVPAYLETLIAYNNYEMGADITAAEKETIDKLLQQLNTEEKKALKEDWGEWGGMGDIVVHIRIEEGYYYKYDTGQFWETVQVQTIDSLEDLEKGNWQETR